MTLIVMIKVIYSGVYINQCFFFFSFHFHGFSQDLLTVCRELNLESSIEELMRELGADESGRISYQEFFRRRLALRPEIEALRSGKNKSNSLHTHTPEYIPTSSDNSLGK